MVVFASSSKRQTHLKYRQGVAVTRYAFFVVYGVVGSHTDSIIAADIENLNFSMKEWRRVANFVRGLRDGANPAAWNGQLKHVLGKRRPAPKHFPALDYQALPDFWTRLQAKSGMGALALQFTILTAARSGEVRGATWDEIDLKECLWTIPGERMKAGKLHIIPLSLAAIDILQTLSEAPSSLYVFPGARRGKPLSDMTLTKALRDMEITNAKGEPVTAHGFRSTFSDWTRNETDFPRELIEESLAHSLGKVEAAYRRGAAIEKRRELMEAWSSILLKATE